MQIGNLKLAKRIVIAPMGQYSAEDGQMNDWHLMHLGTESSGTSHRTACQSTRVREARVVSAVV
jgi:2,4-dienoyl-CoA reductase-like NADH-dependent reductase (Old Yellow Enzyme family)